MVRFEKAARLFKLDANPAKPCDRRNVVQRLLKNKSKSAVRGLFCWGESK